MPSIEINEKIYNELKHFAEFVKQPLESIIEQFLEKDLEALKDNPLNVFEYFFEPEQLKALIFGNK